MDNIYNNTFGPKARQVELCAEKTKLQAFCTKKLSLLTQYQKDTSSLKIGGKTLLFADSTEHVGVIRSVTGNLPNILSRFTAHNNALGAVLHTGMARGHHGNPAASIAVDKLYGQPVLFSGLASLVLSKSEADLIDQHQKTKVENLLRLPEGTPRAVTSFLSGSLPGKAQLHLRQFSLFGMVTRLPGNILHQHAWNSLVTSKVSHQSWFTLIRELCLCYDLPHPLTFLENPLSKASFKALVKKKITSYWEIKLRSEAAVLPSLEYFNPLFMSLTKPHPLLLTAASSPYEVIKATVQAKMLSGRYRTERLCRHWSLNAKGVCLISTCVASEVSEDLEHILSKCPALEKTRSSLANFTNQACSKLPQEVSSILQHFCQPSHPLFIQFILDCSQFPVVISGVQNHGEDVLAKIFHVTRTWCYSLHRERLKLLRRWKTF